MRWNFTMSRNNKSVISIVVIMILVVALSVVAGCGNKGASGNGQNQVSASEGQENAKIEKIKLNLADISSNPVFRVAASKGIFAKHGIEAELVTFATPAEGINALFIKQVDIAWGADFPILNAVSKGEYSIVASTGDATDKEAADWKLFVRDDIQSAEDLKGKKLSFLRGTFQPYLWDEYLGEQGVEITDSELIGQGALDEAYVAIKKGEIDAVWTFGAVMKEKFSAIEGVHQLTDMSQTKVRLGSDIVVPNDLIKNHPDTVTQFLQAIEESTAYIKENHNDVADLLYKEVKQPKEATLKDLEVNNWEIGFTQRSIESLKSQKLYMVENGIIQQDFELTEKINLDFLRKVVPDRITYQP
ncbi:putative aliphatic sulfonates-binding protein precursor [compost metagenome]